MTACLTDCPDDVLWLIFRNYIVDECAALPLFEGWRRNAVMFCLQHHGRSPEPIGFPQNSDINKLVLRPLSKLHSKIARMIKRRMVFRYPQQGWEFRQGSFDEFRAEST
jgi:hypothetical protein